MNFGDLLKGEKIHPVLLSFLLGIAVSIITLWGQVSSQAYRCPQGLRDSHCMFRQYFKYGLLGDSYGMLEWW